MKTVGSYEAKTHLPRLLERVAKGERIAITKHGVPIAMLVPAQAGRKADPTTAAEELRKFRKQHPMRGLSLRAMIAEGRRFR